MATHQVDADEWQSGEQEVPMEYCLAALPGDVCVDRVRLFLEFQVFLPSVQSCLGASEPGWRVQEPQLSSGYQLLVLVASV